MEQLEISFTFKHHTFRCYNVKRIVLNALKNKVIPAFKAAGKLCQLPKFQFSFPFAQKKMTNAQYEVPIILGIELFSFFESIGISC